jgi:hypothetical protein
VKDDRYDVLERYAVLFDAHDPSYEGFVRRRDRKRRNQRIVAGAVGLAVFIGGLWFLVAGGWLDVTRAPTVPGSPVPRPTTSAPRSFPGLPAAGAAPSTPARGRLVLSVSAGWRSLWVYADGRLIWAREGYFNNASNDGTGMFEQHLTSQGIEFLRAAAATTGLFEHDLDLLRGDGDPPYLEMRVRNGDRLVRVTWAVQENYHIGRDAPHPTHEQARVLRDLSALLSDPTRWPRTVWEDPRVVAYVPSTYRVCLRVVPKQVDVTRGLALLPGPVADLLRFRDQTAGGMCYEMATADAREVAVAFDRAGFIPLQRGSGEPSWLKYDLVIPVEVGDALWVFFSPVLPHGEGVFFGPG